MSSTVPSSQSTPVVNAHCVPALVLTTHVINPAIARSNILTMEPVHMNRRQSIRFTMLKMLFPRKSVAADAYLFAHRPDQYQMARQGYDRWLLPRIPNAISCHEKKVQHRRHQQIHSCLALV